MRKQTMSDLLAMLDKAEDKALKIRLHSEENYEHFNSEILKLRQQLVDLDDDKDYFTAEDYSIVHDVTLLEIQMDNYMKSGKVGVEPELLFGEELLSGNESDKQVRINTYKTLALYIASMQSVDINRLRQLKEQWEREKGGHNYSVAELNEIEIALANAFIDYQIKTCANEGVVPKDAKEDYCVPQVYEREFKKRLFDYVASLPKGSIERLDLETYCFNWNLENVIKNKSIWKGLSGREPERIEEPTQLNNSSNQVDNIPKPNQEQEKTQHLPLNLNEQTKGNSVLVVYEKQLPDGSVEHKKKIVPLGPSGGFKLFLKKDKVVELYFLEGTEELGFSHNGGTSSNYSHLSEFPNLRNVYLPSTLRKIEQGYFYNCDNLENIFLSKGVFYNPNRQLFPEGTNIVYPKEEAEHSIVINEDKEEAAVFTQELSTGQHLTIKVPLKDRCLLPKSFIRAGYGGIKEVRFTEGTTKLAASYWTDEYESIEVRGGKYSDIFGLKKIVLPEGLKRLSNRTFAGCSSLEEVELPSSLRTIRDEAFKGCTALKNIHFKEGLEDINAGTFRGCTSLNRVDLPESLEAIHEDAFNGCENLTTVVFPNEMEEISSRAFKDCYRLSTLKMPSRIKTIYIEAFENCVGLRRVCLPRRVDNLWGQSFKNCLHLEEVLLPRDYPNTVEPFTDCSNLKYRVYSDFMPVDMDPEEYLTQEVSKIKEAKEEENRKKSEEARIRREQINKTLEEDSEDIEK